MKQLRFTIAYLVAGNKTIELIEAKDYQAAKKVCESKGQFFSCQYMEQPGDLAYCH